MGVALVMAAALPEAFGARGLVFAACYAGLQVGRTLVVLFLLGPGHALAPNFRRILGWLAISALFWIAGGLAEGTARLALWAAAVGCEYFAPMTGFALPGLGRSRTGDWTISGGHLAERCQLFVIVALGESILITGATLGSTAAWSGDALAAVGLAFVASLALWWLYFDTGSRRGAHLIEHSDDPGRLGAYFHYVHVVILAGVIVCAVAAELVIAHPHGAVKASYAAATLGGPAIYLVGNALYKRVVFGRLPLSHLVGLAGLAALAPLVLRLELLAAAGCTTVLLVAVAAWESLSRRSGAQAVAHGAAP